MLRLYKSKQTDGLMEGTNSPIQVAKCRSRGLRSIRYLMSMIYLITGKPNLLLSPLTLATHTK